MKEVVSMFLGQPLSFVAGLGFALLVHKPEDVTWINGLWLGLFTGVIFSMFTMGINYLYQRR